MSCHQTVESLPGESFGDYQYLDPSSSTEEFHDSFTPTAFKSSIIVDDQEYPPTSADESPNTLDPCDYDSQHRPWEWSSHNQEGLVDLWNMAQSQDELGYESECEEDHSGGVSLTNHDPSAMDLDKKDRLDEYSADAAREGFTPTDDQSLNRVESLELLNKATELTLDIGAIASSDEEPIATGIVERMPDDMGAVEDRPAFAPESSGFSVYNQDPGSRLEPFQYHPDLVEVDDTDEVFQTLAPTYTPEYDQFPSLAEDEPIHLEELWDPLQTDLEDAEANLESTEAGPDEPFLHEINWTHGFAGPISSSAGFFFSPFDEIRNMTFTECLDFWNDGFGLQQRYLSNCSTPGSDNFPPLTASGIQNGMQGRIPDTVTKSHITRGQYDSQGLKWDEFRVQRSEARNVRHKTYFNHVNRSPSYPSVRFFNKWPMFCSAPYMNYEARKRASINRTGESYFHFSRMNLKHKLCIPHFQLRHTLSASSKNAIFFPTVSKDDRGRDTTGSNITCLNPDIDDDAAVIDSANIGPDSDTPRMQKIYTLSAKNDILIAGGLYGEYAMKSLSSTPSSPFVSGMVSDVPHTGVDFPNTSINHVHTFLGRCSGLPQAVFSSNDCHVHILDCNTNTFVARHDHTKQVNCAATSPGSGRLRVLVRDAKHPLLVEADSGKRIGKLAGHVDFGFACDWSEDGVHFATGAQDGLVNIFDVRAWRTPIRTLAADLGGVRALQFSPLGGGESPVLLMAESADFVHVVGGVGWDREQRVDFFGEVAGVGFEGEGKRFWIGVADPEVGGCMGFERGGGGGRQKVWGRAWGGRRRAEEEEEEEEEWWL
ncbi:MAG: hypothetical protein Q9219_007367 [cf. Caloplaca sp. 3 TL-2023]